MISKLKGFWEYFIALLVGILGIVLLLSRKGSDGSKELDEAQSLDNQLSDDIEDLENIGSDIDKELDKADEDLLDLREDKEKILHMGEAMTDKEIEDYWNDSKDK